MPPDPLAALRGECELLSELVLALPEESFARPTRLPLWDVKEVLAHLHRGIDRINAGLDAAEPAEADSDSVAYWRSDDPTTEGLAIAGRATEEATRYDRGHALAAAWDERWRRTLARAADVPRERVVETWGPTLAFDEYLRTRVLETTVHRMDIHDALGLPPNPDGDALEIVEEILIALLDALPPGTSPVSGVALVEIGTGRRQPTDAEREALGDLAERFPLLS